MRRPIRKPDVVIDSRPYWCEYVSHKPVLYSVGHIGDYYFSVFDSMAWDDAQYGMWLFTTKAIPLLLLFIWFFTNKHWWYHTLLVPIVMYIYQIMGLFNQNTESIDESQLVYLIPVMGVIIPTIYLIRARIFNRINEANKSMEELEEEFKISPKNFWDKIKQYF